MSHLMIDIETLSTQPNAVILTLAAQRFNPFGTGYPDQEFIYERLTLESQEDRHIDDSTIEWWATQPPAVQEAAFGESNRLSLEETLDKLHRLAWHSDFVWMQGPTFDAVILENAYRSLNKVIPWSFWKIRDSRTVISLSPGADRPTVEHDALGDARGQILRLQAALARLGVERFA